MTMYHRYTNVAPDSHLTESPVSSSIISNPADNPRHVGRQVREVRLSEATSASRTMTSSRAFEAITIEDRAPAFTLAPAPATSATHISSSWSPSRTNSGSSPVVFALDISSTLIDPDNEVTPSQGLTETTAVPCSTAHASTSSTIHPSFSSNASESAATASPNNIESARTTGIIIGSVLGGLAVLVTISLAIFYMVWRRRRRMPDKTDRENATQQRSNEEATSGAGGTTEERKRSAERPTLPLEGAAAAAAPRILRSERSIVDEISPMSPIMPHLSRWTSEKADIPSPAGPHPAADVPLHLQHPVFASTHHDHNFNDDGDDGDDDVSPCPSSSPSPGPQTPAPAAVAAPAAAFEDAALGGFLFFNDNSPSSRSSTRRPSTRDSSAPRTVLSTPPRRRHTRAGGARGRDGVGGGSAARSRRGSGSSAGGGGDCGGGGGGVASSAGPPSLPPPLPARSAARSNSLHDVERPAVWI